MTPRRIVSLAFIVAALTTALGFIYMAFNVAFTVWMLQSYFDTIPHDELMHRVEERISDGRVLALIRSFLDQDILKGLERWTPTAGTPK